MKTLTKTISWVSLFAIAMGFLESAVVIYLREIYYKEGFNFPLKPMSVSLSVVEIAREAATVIMLTGIGFLAGKTKLQRFAYFNLAFAVWDIFYYIFLYVFLGWPQSLFTWDILFLIPAPWVGPVWAPVLLSLLMITGSLHIIIKTDAGRNYVVKKRDWLLLITGALVCILSFLWDYFSAASGTNAKELFADLQTYVPGSFNYALFFSGFLLMAFPVLTHLFKNQKTNLQ